MVLNSTKKHCFFSPKLVGDEILHRVIGEELLELPIELRRQILIVGDDQRRLVQLLYHICHGKCLTRSGDAEEGLALVTFLEALN